jgi:hypothetical protein
MKLYQLLVITAFFDFSKIWSETRRVGSLCASGVFDQPIYTLKVKGESLKHPG